MKKVTTESVVAISAIGIDLGDQTAYYAMLNEQGECIEDGTVPMTPNAFRRFFTGREPAPVAIEAGAQSRWASKILRECGHDVIVANPRQLRLISSNTSKNDRNDAKLLAKLARMDRSLLSPLEHRSDTEQNALLAIRARAQLVKSRVALLHSLRGMVKCYGIRLPAGTSAQFAERCRQALPSDLFGQLEGLLKVAVELSSQIEAYDDLIAKLAAEHYPVTNRLAEVPGVGVLTALTFVTTLGDPKRFAHSRDVGSYLGLRPRQQQSGERNPQLGITKAGDPYLRKLLVQGAHCLLHAHGQDTAIRRWGLRLCERGGSNAKKRAVVAVARKLAVLLHALWVKGADYRAFPANA